MADDKNQIEYKIEKPNKPQWECKITTEPKEPKRLHGRRSLLGVL